MTDWPDGPPILSEMRDGYRQDWYCPVPALMVRYQVIREERITEGGLPVRRVYEVMLAGV